MAESDENNVDPSEHPRLGSGACESVTTTTIVAIGRRANVSFCLTQPGHKAAAHS